MDGRDRMRAADTDRETTAERLRVALEEGRLDLHEYDERLQQTYGAKTYAELDAVLADLPGPAPAQRSALTHREPAPAPADPADPGRPPVTGAPVSGAVAVGGGPARRLAEVWGPWLRVAAILTAIWLISSLGSRELLFYWPLWALGPWGVVLLFRTAGGFAAGAPGRDVDRWDRRRAGREVRRRQRWERHRTHRTRRRGR
ncbi:DUF1707 domain-containing protein [Micromonospora sp. NPDC092111]|uniref:DUF1707 SHOCT-like domain-containing protein n=1 Tax=Micromonospora sp. NPDC092111 TaxID=3364289 RepID=UPI0038133868